MPTYTYFCKVHKEFEIQQSIKDLPLKECPACKEEGIVQYTCNFCKSSWISNIDVKLSCKTCGSGDVTHNYVIPKKLISLSSFILVGGGWAKQGYSDK